MTIEPREQGTPTEAGPGATSPLRWVFVIVPLLIILAAGTNLMGLWTTSFQQAARREPLKETEPRLPDETIFRPPLPVAPSTDDAPQFDVATVLALLATARPEDGASTFRMCGPCHAGEKNGPIRIAPTLWGIVDHPKAAYPGFRFSEALKAKGGTWSYRELAEYLHNPRQFAPGTSMAFAGIKDNARMANLLAYLRTLSDSRAPLPR